MRLTPRYLLARLGMAALVVALAMLINFAIPRLMPGDAVEAQLAQLSAGGGQMGDTQATAAAMRARFGLPEAAYNDRTVVVVLEAENTSTGLVVDGVSEVTEIQPDQIEPRTSLKSLGKQSVVKGLGKRAQRVSFILDVRTLLSADAIAV